jgi:hypothetical protein
MLTKNKYFIGSKWINKNNDWARINHTVKVNIPVLYIIVVFINYNKLQYFYFIYFLGTN